MGSKGGSSSHSGLVGAAAAIQVGAAEEAVASIQVHEGGSKGDSSGHSGLDEAAAAANQVEAAEETAAAAIQSCGASSVPCRNTISVSKTDKALFKPSERRTLTRAMLFN